MNPRKQVTVTKSMDSEYADSVLKSPEIWPHVSDDASQKDTFSVKGLIQKDIIHVMKVMVEKEPGGVVVLLQNGKGVELHTNLLENCRGGLVLKVAHDVMAYIFNDLQAPYVVTYVFNNKAGRSAKLMARFVGFKEYRRDFHPNTINGVQTERIWFGLTKGEWENNGKLN